MITGTNETSVSPKAAAEGSGGVEPSMPSGLTEPRMHAALSVPDSMPGRGHGAIRPVIDSQSDLFNPVMGALVVARVESTTDRIELSARWKGAQIARDGQDAVIWVSQSDLAWLDDNEVPQRPETQLAALADDLAEVAPNAFDPALGAIDIFAIIAQQEPLFPIETRADLAIGRMIDFFERAENEPPLVMVVGDTMVELGLLLSVLANDNVAAPLASFIPGSPEFGEEQEPLQGGGADFALYDPGTIGSGERVTGPLDPTELPQRLGFIDELRLPAGIPPVARDDVFTFANTTMLGNLLFDNGSGVDFDPDGNAISIQSVTFTSLPAGTPAAPSSIALQSAATRSRSFAEVELEGGGILTIRANGQIEFVPGVDGAVPQEPVEFTYRLRDATGLTGNRASVTVDFGGEPTTPVPGAPVPADDEFTVNAAGPVRAENLLLDNGSGRDSDPDGDPIEIVSVRTSQDEAIEIGSEAALAGGTLITVRADGTLLIDPSGLAPETDGLRETLRYRLIDDDGNESEREGLVTINVRAGDASIVPALIVEDVAVHSETLDNLDPLAELREARQLPPEQRAAIDPDHFEIIRDAGDDSAATVTFAAGPSRSAFDNVLLVFEIEEDATAGRVQFVLLDDDDGPSLPVDLDLRPGPFGLALVAAAGSPQAFSEASSIRLETTDGAPLPLDGSAGPTVLLLVDEDGVARAVEPDAIGGLFFATPQPDGIPSTMLNPDGRLQAVAGSGDDGTLTVGFEDTTIDNASQPDFNDLIASVDFDVITRELEGSSGPQIAIEPSRAIVAATIELGEDARDSDRLEIGAIDPSITVETTQGGDLLLSGGATAEAYENALNAIRLVSDARVPNAGTRSVSVLLGDADGSETSTVVSFVVRDLLTGTAGNDRLELPIEDRDGRSISGRRGDDVLIGGSGPDTLHGARGDDDLVGGPGADRLTGGRGADRFFIDPLDRITDFDPAADEIIDVTTSRGMAELEALLSSVDEALV